MTPANRKYEAEGFEEEFGKHAPYRWPRPLFVVALLLALLFAAGARAAAPAGDGWTRVTSYPDPFFQLVPEGQVIEVYRRLRDGVCGVDGFTESTFAWPSGQYAEEFAPQCWGGSGFVADPEGEVWTRTLYTSTEEGDPETPAAGDPVPLLQALCALGVLGMGFFGYSVGARS